MQQLTHTNRRQFPKTSSQLGQELACVLRSPRFSRHHPPPKEAEMTGTQLERWRVRDGAVTSVFHTPYMFSSSRKNAAESPRSTTTKYYL